MAQAEIRTEPMPAQRAKPDGRRPRRPRRLSEAEQEQLRPVGVTVQIPGGVRRYPAQTEYMGQSEHGRPRWRVVPPSVLRRIPAGAEIDFQRLPGGGELVY